MKTIYLLLLIPFLISSCDTQMPWESNKIDISNGISLKTFDSEKEGDIISKVEVSNSEFDNSFIFLFEKITSKGKTNASKKVITEYIKNNSEEVVYTEKIIKDYHKSIVIDNNESPHEESIISEIEGETFIYSKKNGKWDVKLKGKNPTKKQQEYINDEIVSKNNECSYNTKDEFKDKKTIKLGEKINLDNDLNCILGVGKLGNFKNLSLSFNDTMTIDGKLYASFLLLGEIEVSLEKQNYDVEVENIEIERKNSNTKMKSNLVGKIKYCLNDEFLEKLELEMVGKGSSIRDFSGINVPMEIESTVKLEINYKLLSRKK
jgi:hypothetical protein